MSSTIIDVSGLSPEAVREIEARVAALRAAEAIPSPSQADPAKWLERLRHRIELQPVREIDFDDSRRSIYSGCDE